MKLKNIITTAVLALVGSALVETSASAQIAGVNTGDLILGFEVNSGTGTGNTTNLEVDLGAFSNYSSLASGTVAQLNVGSGNFVAGGAGGLSAADLASTYGATWNTRTDLLWSVVGSLGSPSNVTYLTSTTQLFDNPTLPVAGQITPLYNGLSGVTLSANSTTAGTIATSDAGSFTAKLTNNGGNALGNDFGTGFSVQQGVSSSGDSTLSLYSLKKASGSTPGTLVGTFTLGSDGTFTFVAGSGAPAAVPEPLGYALVPCAIGLIMIMRRRGVIG